MILPHGRELLEIIPLAELYTTYKDHERLIVFNQKGCKCVACGRVGTFLIRSREMATNKQARKRKSVGAEHIDLYTDDFVLMTVDHIIPKAICNQQGWTKIEREDIANKQPMCDPCNNKKDNKIVSLEEFKKQRTQANTNVVAGLEIIRSLVTNIHRINGDYAYMEKQT